MNIKESLKNVAKEFLAILLIVVIVTSFIVPVGTLWGGLAYDTVLDELYFIGMKTQVYLGKMKNDEFFDWNAALEGTEYDK